MSNDSKRTQDQTPDTSSDEPGVKRRYCHFYVNRNHCKFGEDCKFSHEKAPLCRSGERCVRERCIYSHQRNITMEPPRSSFLSDKNVNQVPSPWPMITPWMYPVSGGMQSMSPWMAGLQPQKRQERN